MRFDRPLPVIPSVNHLLRHTAHPAISGVADLLSHHYLQQIDQLYQADALDLLSCHTDAFICYCSNCIFCQTHVQHLLRHLDQVYCSLT